MTYTASDSTCSQEYAQISQEPSGGTIHRDAFMKACLTNVDDIAKTDPRALTGGARADRQVTWAHRARHPSTRPPTLSRARPALRA
ncbi:hypothetical protein [Streptomyces sp. NBC_01446]|uniref:hypothetical protein n=1 Tax=Streptomyces sp. NBC_01446 TaxID=2903870 RepID=UPI00224F0945|nr:hypothetical protein [Streptomyces sp. NBC_01446]MCX4641792.1 hypothetical protein [Streptomyces sp. NBC_01446]